MDVVFKMFQQAISEHWQCRRISNEVEKLRKEMDDEVDGTYLEKEPRCFCFACILLTCHILGREEGLRRLGWTGANELFVLLLLLLQNAKKERHEFLLQVGIPNC